jgi:hypothetical protein
MRVRMRYRSVLLSKRISYQCVRMRCQLCECVCVCVMRARLRYACAEEKHSVPPLSFLLVMQSHQESKAVITVKVKQ